MTNKFSNAPKPVLDNISGNIDLTGQVTGILPVAKGGTGVAASTVVVQQVNTWVVTSTTGTTVLPLDDTIPQNTEGDQYMTLAITPTDASNILVITVNAQLSSSITGRLIMALFQDSTANALAVCADGVDTATKECNLVLRYGMTAGTTSSTTFKMRAGNHNAGTTTFNGDGGNRRFGGTLVSSISIVEYAA